MPSKAISGPFPNKNLPRSTHRTHKPLLGPLDHPWGPMIHPGRSLGLPWSHPWRQMGHPWEPWKPSHGSPLGLMGLPGRPMGQTSPLQVKQVSSGDTAVARLAGESYSYSPRDGHCDCGLCFKTFTFCLYSFAPNKTQTHKFV